MIKACRIYFTLIIIFLLTPPKTFSQIDLDIESGIVFGGYNDVRIPGNSGTLFSLTEDLNADPGFFYRIRVLYSFNDRHHIGALFAPLQITADGELDKDLIFQEKTFDANSSLEATYKFNSYRLFYRYDFVKNEDLEIGMGFTAKIRDAKIAISSNQDQSEKTNVGFVPLIHFRLLWHLNDNFGLLLDGDALAAPQGRAEDVIIALIYKTSEKIDLKAGYRIVEGGADNDEVYNFALFNYISLGIIVHL